MEVILKEDIARQLRKVGLERGDTVMVHTSLKQMGYVCGGAQTVIEALIEVVGDTGTILMPTQSWKNLDPEEGVHWEADEADWQKIRDNWPAYDKHLTPTNTMGAVAEMFRKYPGSLRSDHPARSVCAWGRNAAYLTEKHDFSNIFGDGSPIGKLYELDGKVLLLGTGYDKIPHCIWRMPGHPIPESIPTSPTARCWRTASGSGRPMRPCLWTGRILKRSGQALSGRTR